MPPSLGDSSSPDPWEPGVRAQHGSPPPRGVFGFVKRVQHKGNQMSCAAKFIPLRSRTRTQAYRERDILATLSHPLVTGLLDQFETRKTLILVLELYPALSPRKCGEGRALGRQGSEGPEGPVLPVSLDTAPSLKLRSRGPGTGAGLCPQGPGHALSRPLPCSTWPHQQGGPTCVAVPSANAERVLRLPTQAQRSGTHALLAPLLLCCCCPLTSAPLLGVPVPLPPST